MTQMKLSFEEMLEKANTGVPSLSPVQAHAALSDENTLFVDIRDIRFSWSVCELC